MDSGKAILGVAGNKYLLPVIFFYLFPGRLPGRPRFIGKTEGVSGEGYIGTGTFNFSQIKNGMKMDWQCLKFLL